MGDTTFFEGLTPVFVTSAAVTDKVIDDFLQTSASNYEWQEDWPDVWSFSIQRTKADAAREIARVAADGHPMRGTRPPVGPNPPLDFENASTDELAKYVLRNFGSDEVEEINGEFVRNISPEEWARRRQRPNIDTRYFVILDDKTVRDRSMLLVEIPTQREQSFENEVPRVTRNWTKREDYEDPALGDDEDEQMDMKMLAARIFWEEAYRIAMCQMSEEDISYYAEIAREYGAFSQGNSEKKFAAYQAAQAEEAEGGGDS